MHQEYIVSNFYKFLKLNKIDEIKIKLKNQLINLDIKGSFLIGNEGVNGSFSVKTKDLRKTISLINSVFNEKFKVDGVKALDLAYNDIREAFIHYLENFNQGKPIIIASHSQGTIHAKRLISEFIDGKELQKQLIAAYLVGMKVNQDEFNNIKQSGNL